MTAATDLSPTEKLEKLRRLHEMLRYQWGCGLPDCDGKPGHVIPGLGITHPFPHARAKQLPPDGTWRAWAMVTGRGFGKTRSAAEWVKRRMLSEPKHRVGIVAPDFGTAKNVCMEGESGLLSILPGDRIESYNKSTAELTLVNGSQAFVFSTNSASDAEKVRGPQFHSMWYEELATQRYGETAWDLAQFSLRLGQDPRAVVTTTPRNVPIIRRLLKTEPSVEVTRGSTLENADNLAASTVSYLKQRYDGTTLGRQELEGLLLEASPGALWTTDMIDPDRVETSPDLDRIVVGVDPAGSHRTSSDRTGIVVVGQSGDQFYVLADYSGRYTPEEWGRQVVAAYHEHKADKVVVERNFGGDMVESTIRNVDRNVRVSNDTRATRGKVIRAEPVVGLYEQHRVHHVGTFADLETDMTTWVPPGAFELDERTGASVALAPSTWSPDIMDAMVWGLTELSQKRKRMIRGFSSGE